MNYKFLNKLQKEIWEKKYKYKTDTCIEDTWKRVADSVASVEHLDEYWREKFYSILHDFNFIPGGRITAGAGTENDYLLNCAVIGVEDDLASIYDTIKKAALMFKANYGCGFSFHKIRPKNSPLSKGGRASGVISFMRVFDTSCAVIQTGGSDRRGAQIAVLPIWHPDIEEFIDAKRTEGMFEQFNTSVGITESFVNAVENDLDFDLVFDGKVYKTVKARDLFDKICYSGWMYNDPGLIFLDEANKCNNGYYFEGYLWATNP